MFRPLAGLPFGHPDHNDTEIESIMKWSPLYLAALTPFAFFSSGVLLGHTVVLMVTLGIFFGTLSLGRTQAPAQTQPPPRSIAS